MESPRSPRLNPPPSRKGETLKKKYEAVYRYFEQLGPGRTLEQTAKAWKGMAGERQIRVMAKRFGWWARVRVYDETQIQKAATENKSALDAQYQLLLDGIDATLKKAFVRLPDGRVVSSLPMVTWDEAAKVVRIRDYLLGNTGRDPKDLANPASFSMAVVALLQEFKAEGNDPYTATAQQARKWIDSSSSSSTT